MAFLSLQRESLLPNEGDVSGKVFIVSSIERVMFIMSFRILVCREELTAKGEEMEGVILVRTQLHALSEPSD